jgi:hypothetical protein
VRFNSHSNLAGTHAFLGASNYHWINYDDGKLKHTFETSQAARRGVELHELARNCIRLGVKLHEGSQTISQYVNDAIGFGMTPEQILYYSDNCYGTADAIGFRKNKLRIHDFKSGRTKSSEWQLYIYAALFCLEYLVKPHEIEIELRIYQNGDVMIWIADPDIVVHIMDKIVTFDKYIEAWKQDELG